MDENDSMSTFTTEITHLSSTLENFIKQERTSQDNIEDFDHVLGLLNDLKASQNLETVSTITQDNINENKPLYYSQLREGVTAYQMPPPASFIKTLRAFEVALSQKNEKCLANIKILRSKRDKMKNEVQSLANRIEIFDKIQLKRKTKHKEKQDPLNRTKIEEEIDKKHRECKQDLINIMRTFYPGDRNITGLLQELFSAHKQGGSASYVRIDVAESPLVNALKDDCIIECNPTNPKEIKFTIFS